MKNFHTLVILCFVALNLQAQAIYKTIDSYKLEGKRELKIQLPRNYNPEEKRTYPLIIVFDGLPGDPYFCRPASAECTLRIRQPVQPPTKPETGPGRGPEHAGNPDPARAGAGQFGLVCTRPFHPGGIFRWVAGGFSHCGGPVGQADTPAQRSAERDPARPGRRGGYLCPTRWRRGAGPWSAPGSARSR